MLEDINLAAGSGGPEGGGDGAVSSLAAHLHVAVFEFGFCGDGSAFAVGDAFEGGVGELEIRVPFRSDGEEAIFY